MTAIKRMPPRPGTFSRDRKKYEIYKGSRSDSKGSNSEEIIDLTSIPSSEDEIDKDTSLTTDSKTLIMIGDIPFRERERSILLQPLEWLTDEIINAFGMRLMQVTGPSLHCCSSFFFTRLLQGDASTFDADRVWLRKWRETWSLGSATRLILIPINWNNSHWALAAYEREEGVIRYYDSMMNNNKAQRALILLRKAFIRSQLLPLAKTPAIKSTRGLKKNGDQVGVLAFIISKMGLGDTKTSTNGMMNDDDDADLNNNGDRNSGDNLNAPLIKIETPPKQVQQIDGSSCGVFVCWRMQQLSNAQKANAPSRGPDLCNPNTFRRVIYNTIMNNL